MSAAPRHSDLGHAGLRMSAADFFAIGETSECLQLVDGVVLMSPRPTPLHQTILRLVLRQIERYLDDHPGAACFPEVDWELRPDTVYSPDIACYAPGRIGDIPARLTTAPDLIIEILSPGTKAFDLTTKKDDYETCGVGEYWTIDPVDVRLRCYRRSGDRLLEAVPEEGAVASVALPGLTLDLGPLRAAANKS
ncbi:MAG: Uma2 family endonuclease [Phycisphaerales bacterium JB039]